HKIDLEIASLPPSLLEAIRSFLVAATVCDIRRIDPPHRSMLVNVSSYTAVQDRVSVLVDHYVRELQRDIRNFAALPLKEAIRNRSVRDIRATWARLHEDAAPWEQIQSALNDAVQPIVVRAVNQRTGAASLDYRDQGP